MQLLGNNCRIRANVLVVFIAASGRAMPCVIDMLS